MAEGDVLYEVKGRIAIITLNRPESMNAISIGMREELRKAWERYASSDDQWVAILTGAGDRAFCAGIDLKERSRADARDVEEYKKAIERLGPYTPRDLNIFKPTIAAVNGFALAGGFMLAQHCDLCVAAQHAEFGITEPRWNLRGPWAADLTNQISVRHAMEITIVPVRISAQRAYEMGFVNWVVPREKLMDKAMEVANLILENAPASVSSFIELYYRTYGMSHHQAVSLGGHIQKHLRYMQDTIEGPKAFAEKRKPVFQNK